MSFCKVNAALFMYKLFQRYQLHVTDWQFRSYNPGIPGMIPRVLMNIYNHGDLTKPLFVHQSIQKPALADIIGKDIIIQLRYGNYPHALKSFSIGVRVLTAPPVVPRHIDGNGLHMEISE